MDIGRSRACRRLAFDELGERLGDRALVALVDVDATLWAVVVADGRARLHDGRLQRAGRGRAGVGALRAAPVGVPTRLCRVVAQRRPVGTGRSRAAGCAAAGAAAGPSCRTVRSSWCLRPCCRECPSRCCRRCGADPPRSAPSATVWARAAATAAADMAGRAVLAAGPRLAAADEEVADLAARHPHATRLTGPDATVAAVAAAADGAAVGAPGRARPAAHGQPAVLLAGARRRAR